MERGGALENLSTIETVKILVDAYVCSDAGYNATVKIQSLSKNVISTRTSLLNILYFYGQDEHPTDDIRSHLNSVTYQKDYSQMTLFMNCQSSVRLTISVTFIVMRFILVDHKHLISS